MRILRTRRADEDLIDIWLAIAADDPQAADRMLAAIELRWRQLARHPHSGPARDDIMPGLRHLRLGPYLLLYRIHADAVEILRIQHGRRQIGRDDIDDKA